MRAALKRLFSGMATKTVPMADIFAYASRHWKDGDFAECIDRMKIIMGALREMEAEGLLRFRKRMALIDGEIVPEALILIRERQAVFAPPEDAAWHPLLHFWPKLRSGPSGSGSRLEMAWKLNMWLMENGIPERRMGVNAFSLIVFGDEKWLKKSGFFGGMLDIGKLNLHDPILPLIFRKGGGEGAIFVENAETWAFVSDWNEEAEEFSAVIYGAGNMIAAKRRNIEETLRLTGSRGATYFGDLDPKGVDMGEKSGFPPCLRFYRNLLENGTRRKDWEGKTRPRGIPSWLGEIGPAVERLWLSEKAWLPQEGLDLGKL